MTSAMLLVLAASPLALALAAPEPPPPPPDPDDELIVEDDEVDASEGDEDPSDDGAVAATDDDATSNSDDATADDATADADTGGPPPAEGTSTSIPTEGEVKAPPSEEALRRESPLAQPEPRTRGRRRPGRPGASPQRFALEFKMGPYLPNIDRQYTGAGLGPYASIFGQTDDTGAAIDQPRQFPMPVLAFEWQFLYLAGPLGLGTQIGLFRDRAQALVTEPGDGPLRSDADDTTFGMVPLALLISYRFELLADRFNVPLVPYAKAGVGYSFFWNTSGSGNLARNTQGDVARGGIPGWQLNAGGMLRLDFIEPGTAKKLDGLTGINHTYIFGEYQLNRIDNFGVGQVLDLGDSTWFAGLAIEF